MLVGKIIAAALCLAALIVTFRTENVLKAVFRVDNVNEKMIFKTKIITLCITIALFVAVITIFG